MACRYHVTLLKMLRITLFRGKRGLTMTSEEKIMLGTKKREIGARFKGLVEATRWTTSLSSQLIAYLSRFQNLIANRT